jgi:CubicO group peptidase (beta-lactamase class C family)
VLKETTVAEMTRPRALPDGSDVRTYGFDVDTGYSSPRGERFAKGKTFGHTGFTGTSLWIDPANDAFVILLTNAVHPVHKGKPINPLRRAVGTAVAEAMLPLEVLTPADGAKPQAPAGGAGQ